MGRFWSMSVSSLMPSTSSTSATSPCDITSMGCACSAGTWCLLAWARKCLPAPFLLEAERLLREGDGSGVQLSLLGTLRCRLA